MSRHLVRAQLQDGWTAQACPDATSAVALFDRLRAYPVAVQRLVAGRVVEVTCEPPIRAAVDARAA